MTAPKSILRRRRDSGAKAMPDDLAAWFAGTETVPPWSALLPGDIELLPARWRTWKAEHRGTRPPAGFEWLDDPISGMNATKPNTPGAA